MSMIELALCMIAFSGTERFYYSVAFCFIYIALERIILMIKDKEKRKSIINTGKIELPMGYYLIISNIFLNILCNFLLN